MQYFLVYLLMLVGLVLISKPMTTIIHELGHAIPMLFLTRQKVTIYIGSYGDPRKSIKINLGLLIIFFSINPLKWRTGLTVSSAKTISLNKQIIYTITGPLASVTLGSISCYLTFALDLHGFLKLFLIIFLSSAFFDFLFNIIPSQIPLQLYDGTITFNDGYSLVLLFGYKRVPKEYLIAVDMINAKQFSEAATVTDKLIKDGEKNENIYRVAILAHLNNKNYDKAKELSDDFFLSNKLNSDDFSNMALAYSKLGLYEDSLGLYDKSLFGNPNNFYTLNNKGYTLNLINKFEEAIPLFDRAIELDVNFAYSYNNRGLSKIKLGKLDEGLNDINKSFELDSNNSYGYMNLGIYHFDKAEFDEAMKLFRKAKELDSTTHKIDELIKITAEKIHAS